MSDSVGPCLRWSAWLVALLCAAGPAMAQTGVSDDRVSLPDGPGSLEGIGENVDIDPNMGLMRYSVRIITPAGHAHVQPSLALSYSSGSGNGVVGMGWSMATPHIERMTYRGLPQYTLDDDFSLDGGYQMVRIPDTDPAMFRTRYEKDFIRYTWFPGEGEPADGADGWFLVEYRDGTKAYYGADRDGTIVPEARMQGERGTFRYMLVDKVDVYGHVAHYDYVMDGVIPLVSRIGYVFPDYLNGAPRYRVEFDYEERRDDDGLDYLNDCAPGYETVLTRRLSAVNVFSGDERIRQYALEYEGYATSGGFTRLLGVDLVGLDGEAYPIRETFTYSRALGGVCGDGEVGCENPFVVDMGPIGDVDLGAGTATLIDINGDALPDIVNTNEGAHQFILNRPSVDGTSSFVPGVVSSELGTSAGHRLGGGVTQVMDVNGDGFSDIVNTATGDVLYNRGAGDWLTAEQLRADGFPAFDARFDALGEGQLGQVAFLDYDNDKFIDFITSSPEATTIYANAAADGFDVARGVQLIGDGQTGEDLEFSDINGDGLLDASIIRPGELRFRINLGWGEWGEWDSLPHPYEQGAQLELAELHDINGDGLDDLIVVEADVVRYLLNVAGVRFSEEFIIDSDTLGPDVDLPERTDRTEVLYADMNGNGSTDIVWVERMGSARYLEIFPIRPNLLSRIENGIGKVTDIRYGTSVQYLARDMDAAGGDMDVWANKLPHPMIVVAAKDAWDRLTELHEITEYVYHDGFYDGIEKQFRGYARVETVLEGSDGHESGEVRNVFDVGADDPYFNGLLIQQESFSGGRALTQFTDTYEDCPLDGLPADRGVLDLPVRFICKTAGRTVIKEGQGPDQWVTTEQRLAYDGYGNAIEMDELGVVSIGDGGCAPCDGDAFGAPCGPTCRGDETFVRTDFIPPGEATNGRWHLHLPWRERVYGEAGGATSEALIFYDGDPYVGLPQGTADLGDVTRTTALLSADSGQVIELSRTAYDAHGNVVGTLDPNGTVDGDDHRRSYVYDADGLRVNETNVHLTDGDGQPYLLKRAVQYEPVFDRIVESTQWMRYVGGETTDQRRSTFYGYDQFGRMTWLAKPGDGPAAPTRAFEYDLDSPASRIIERERSQAGGPLDLTSVRCIDGRGRQFQSRNEIGPGEVQVDGYMEFNPRGSLYRDYDGYLSDSLECDLDPPADVPFETYRRDAQFRVTEITDADASLYGTDSAFRNTYGPLWMRSYDREDSDPESPHADTPIITHMDGTGRVVAYDRVLAGGGIATTTLHYDGLGHITGYTDADGNRRTQSHDLVGRVLRVVDPNQGTTEMTYDDAGNVLSQTDANGITVRMVYDGDNRLVEYWDDADRDGTLVRTVYDAPESCPAVDCSNAAGNIVERFYPGGRHRVGYDARDRLVYSAREIEGHWLPFRVEFDQADRMTAMTYPGGRTLRYGYDGGSRLQSIEDVVDLLDYDERDRLGRVEYANGVVETVGYDVRQRLQRHTIEAGGEVLFGYGVTRNRQGHALDIADLADDMDRLVDVGVGFTYDAWYRPTEVHLARGSIGDEVITYAFDLIDNVTSITSDMADSPMNVGALTYGAHGPNAVDQAGDRDYAYDAAGRMQDRDGASLGWDFQDRMTSYVGPDITATYRYGEDNLRTFKREGDLAVMYPASDFEVRDGVAVIYVKMEDRLVARLEEPAFATTLYTDLAPAGDADGAITVADAWLAHAAAEGLVDEVEATDDDPALLLAAGTARALVAGREQTWLHQDHLGGVAAATRDGALTGRQAFHPTGLPRLPAPIDPHGFTGMEHDRTGLIEFPFRYLDPQTGRWLNPDPQYRVTDAALVADHGQATVAYAYVSNQFGTLIDPTGLGNGHPHKSFTERLGSKMTTVRNLFGGVKQTAKDKTGISKVEQKADKLKKKALDKSPKKVQEFVAQGKKTKRLRDYDASALENGTAYVLSKAAGKGAEVLTAEIPVLSTVAKKGAEMLVDSAVHAPMDYKRDKDNPNLIGSDQLTDPMAMDTSIDAKTSSMGKDAVKKGHQKVESMSMSISADATFPDAQHTPRQPSTSWTVNWDQTDD